MQRQPQRSMERTIEAEYIISGTAFTDGGVFPDSLVAVGGGRILYSGPRSSFDGSVLSGVRRIDLPPGGAILPGLIDLHCHGAAGGDFPAANEESSRAALAFLHGSGTTTLLASVVTASRPDLLAAIRSLKPLGQEGLIAGIHAEGPFLSHARCGAQDPRWLLEPDLGLLRDLIREADGWLKTMTYAPELDGASELVDMLAGNAVIPSLGHTDCDSQTAAASLEQAAQAIARAGRAGPGARPTVTHLFNGMPPMHHRRPGPVAACLRLAEAGTIAVELIADGVHLDPETVRMVFGLVGAENVVLVTDSMAATGLPDGDYDLGPSSVSVTESVAKLKGTGSLAGGTATLLDVVRRTIAAGVSPARAVASATSVPARLLGLAAEIGSLREGMQADIVMVDQDFKLVSVLRKGRQLAAPILPGGQSP